MVIWFYSCAPQRVAPTLPKLKLVSPYEYLENANPSPSFQKAYASYQEGLHANARSELQKILKTNPDHSPSILLMAYTYLAEDQIDLAERYSRQALEIMPDYAQAHYALAITLEQKGEFDSAHAELKEVLRIVPDYPGAGQNENILRLKATEQHLEEARTLVTENPQEAIRHYEIAQTLAPEMTQIPLEIAEILLKQDRCEEARAFLEQAKVEAPETDEARYHYAGCLVQDQEFQRAMEIYQELAATQPDNPELQTRIKEVQEQIKFLQMPLEFQNIRYTEEISRAQLASLIITELEFLRKYSSPDSLIITDTLNHWAQTYIQKAVDLGILELFPNRTFQPDRTLTKLELAKAASRLIQVLETNEGKTIPNPEKEIFVPDVPGSNIYYPMIAKAVSASVISLDADGRFHLNRAVSGAEAMSMVNRLKSISETP